MPSKKSLQNARDAIREKTGPKNCYKPPPPVVKDLNSFLRGWGNYFGQGYPRKAFRDVSHFARKHIVTHPVTLYSTGQKTSVGIHHASARVMGKTVPKPRRTMILAGPRSPG